MSKSFGEEIYDRLSTILERSMGSTLGMQQIDRLRMESGKLADLIAKQVEKIAQEKALTVCKLLNDATKAGFAAISAELTDIKARLPK